MTGQEIRNWLGVFFIVVTIGLCGVLLLAGYLGLLGMEPNDAVGAVEILLPVFVGQLTIVYKWFAGPDSLSTSSRKVLPAVFVKLPPLLVVILLLVAAVIAGISGQLGKGLGPAGLKHIVAFCVMVLNASTVLVVARYFQVEGQESK